MATGFRIRRITTSSVLCFRPAGRQGSGCDFGDRREVSVALPWRTDFALLTRLIAFRNVVTPVSPQCV
jgi:hypothetical protein